MEAVAKPHPLPPSPPALPPAGRHHHLRAAILRPTTTGQPPSNINHHLPPAISTNRITSILAVTINRQLRLTTEQPPLHSHLPHCRLSLPLAGSRAAATVVPPPTVASTTNYSKIPSPPYHQPSFPLMDFHAHDTSCSAIDTANLQLHCKEAAVQFPGHIQLRRLELRHRRLVSGFWSGGTTPQRDVLPSPHQNRKLLSIVIKDPVAVELGP